MAEPQTLPGRYGVMGNPIHHSRSPEIHRRFAAQFGRAIDYRAILVEPGRFPEAVAEFRAQGGRGLNVTVPFKGDAYALATRRSERAQLAGAVNTLSLETDGALYGDNTDGVGLIRDLTVNLGLVLRDRALLVVGAGGAVRGVLGPLLAEAPAAVVIANRTASRAEALAQRFAPHGRIAACGFAALAGRGFDLVINATTASLRGELPPLPDTVFAPGALAYDLMYGDAPTPFLVWAGDRGAARLADGLGMLVEQAAESFRLWHGLAPQTRPVIAALRRGAQP